MYIDKKKNRIESIENNYLRKKKRVSPGSLTQIEHKIEKVMKKIKYKG